MTAKPRCRLRCTGTLASLAGAMISASVAPAQSAGADNQITGKDSGVARTQAPIIVTGSRDRKQAVHRFVRDITVETDDQIAKFPGEVCPAAFGLPSAYAAIVAKRAREVARTAGVPVGKAGCRPNVVIAVADDGHEFVKSLRKARPTLFRALKLPELRRLAEAEGPVRSWQVVEPRGADGRPMERISFIAIGGRLQYIGDAYELKHAIGSRVQMATRQDLTLSFVVFDLKAVQGLTLTQIADYATMRALAKTRSVAGTGGAARSILALFDPARDRAGRPAALTRWDSAYLKALYATSNVVAASRQRSEIARMAASELNAAE